MNRDSTSTGCSQMKWYRDEESENHFGLYKFACLFSFHFLPQCGKNHLNLYCIPLHNLFPIYIRFTNATPHSNELFSMYEKPIRCCISLYILTDTYDVLLYGLIYCVYVCVHLKPNSQQYNCRLSLQWEKREYIASSVEFRIAAATFIYNKYIDAISQQHHHHHHHHHYSAENSNEN